ncbi:MAG: hypothetical protein ACKVJC_03145 [Flavobacteriales bacterium]|nr:hypothetical protein [Crocinitomicaceae bacterium]MDB4323843.1 hypothetical protein [Crocinitomicaceae bacterium]
MKDKWSFHTLFLPFGVLICGLVFLIHFFILEKSIHDYRLTFSVTSSEYESIFSKIIDFKHDDKEVGFFSSPNFESIADSLAENDIRRFELKIFTPSKVTPKKCATIYFNQLDIFPCPMLIGISNFGTSTPLQKSLGFFLLLLSLLLILDFVFIKHRSRK